MRKYSPAVFAPLFLFGLAILPVLLRLSGRESGEGFLTALSVLVLDCSGFLTVLCAAAIAICLHRRAKGLAAFYLMDAVVINRLYLNVQWPLLLGRLSDLWGTLKEQNVLIYAFFAIITVFGLRAFWKSFHPAPRTSGSDGGGFSGGSASGAENPPAAPAASASSNAPRSKTKEAAARKLQRTQPRTDSKRPLRREAAERKDPPRGSQFC